MGWFWDFGRRGRGVDAVPRASTALGTAEHHLRKPHTDPLGVVVRARTLDTGTLPPAPLPLPCDSIRLSGHSWDMVTSSGSEPGGPWSQSSSVPPPTAELRPEQCSLTLRSCGHALSPLSLAADFSLNENLGACSLAALGWSQKHCKIPSFV